MKIEDAEAKLSESEILLEKGHYPGALLSLQQCLELSSKALLDKLEISYIQKGKRIPHDVSDKFPEAFQKIKEILTLSNYEEEKYRKDLAREGFVLTFLTGTRKYLAYGFENLANITEIFDWSFYRSKEFTENIISTGKDCFRTIQEIISKIEKGNKPI
jgi:HEPN domain-containing protein